MITHNAAPPWHKQFWPWFLVVLPGIAVIASLVSLGIAIVHRDSLVRDNYYKEGLAINERLDQDKSALTRGIALEGSIDRLTITLRLTGSFASVPQVLTMQFMHPLLDKKDFTVALQRSANGTYVGQLPFALSGRWHVEIGTAEDAQWRVRELIDVDAASGFQLSP